MVTTMARMTVVWEWHERVSTVPGHLVENQGGWHGNY